MYTNNPYKQNDLKAMPQNQLEARTLIKAASMLDRVKNNWHELHEAELIPALEHNRKLWTILSSELAEIDHPMDHNLRQNMANLAMFIFKHTIKIMAAKHPTAKDIEVLITINMEIAKGLNEFNEVSEDEIEETEQSDDNESKKDADDSEISDEQPEKSEEVEQDEDNGEDEEEEETFHTNFTA